MNDQSDESIGGRERQARDECFATGGCPLNAEQWRRLFDRFEKIDAIHRVLLQDPLDPKAPPGMIEIQRMDHRVIWGTDQEPGLVADQKRLHRLFWMINGGFLLAGALYWLYTALVKATPPRALAPVKSGQARMSDALPSPPVPRPSPLDSGPSFERKFQ
jgi:hypothetical protein